MVELRDVGYAVGDRPLLEGITASCPPGSLTVVLGPNGAGKSTLLRVAAGLLRPARGEVRYGTRPLTVTFDYKGCGRVHYSTYNTEPNGLVVETERWPASCKTKFSPQERLLEYLFFNVAACVGPPG